MTCTNKKISDVLKKNISSGLKPTKIKKIFLFLILVFIITSGFKCTNPFAKKAAQMKSVKLSVWTVYEERDDLNVLFEKFRNEHPTVSFEYRKFTPEEYEKQLVEAWANDKGPDIYFLPNNLIPEYVNKQRITPMTKSAKLPFRETKITGFGPFNKKDVFYYTKDIALTSINDLQTKFPEVVASDVLISGKIYGLPLSIDTLALFYNRDLLNKSNIPNPPKTWVEFMDQVKKITRISQNEEFIQSGTALGTVNNISNSSDIVALLLMQSNIYMGTNGINFEANKKALLTAVNFFNDFANPIKDIYSWNEKQQEAFEAFKSGQVAFFFGYTHHAQEIRNLNYGITTIPQLQYGVLSNGETTPLNPVNIANYWVMTVSHKTKNPGIAWGFIDFATKKERAKLYLEKSQKPTALKDLIIEQTNNLKIAPFANQILSAKSWYHGVNYELAKKYLSEMVTKIKEAGTTDKINAIIESYQLKINQTIR